VKASLNAISINYVERGPKDGLPLVFIHGFPFSLEMWEPQARAFSEKYRTLAYDLRGHGSSDAGDGQYTIDFFVDDLLALLDRLGIEKAVLCGLSMGGYITLRTVERSPERVKGIILCNTRSESDSNEAKTRRSNTIKTVKTRGVEEFAEDFVKSIFSKVTVQSRPEIVEKIKRIILKTSPLGICGTQLALSSRTDSTPMLISINVPVLILVGEHDILTPPSAAQALHEKIAGSELHVIPGAAHMSNLENTEMFNALVEAFLKKHW
jgi:3-oxoadipate enol-lactonase